jgi:hypothetical protein
VDTEILFHLLDVLANARLGEVHHFGCARKALRLRYRPKDAQLIQIIHELWLWIPSKQVI